MVARTVRLGRWAALLLALAASTQAAQKVIYESEPRTVTATIDALDKASRVVTLMTEAGNRLHVTAPKEMEGFDRLRAGDVVTAKYFEAIAVRLAKPGSPAPSSDPTVSIRRKDDVPGSEAMQERTFRATVTAIDTGAPSMRVRTTDGVERAMAVTDVAQLKALKVGDVLDVTFYESRLVSVERPRK